MNVTNPPFVFGDGLCATCVDGHQGSPAEAAHSTLDVKAVCSFDIDETLLASSPSPVVASQFKASDCIRLAQSGSSRVYSPALLVP